MFSLPPHGGTQAVENSRPFDRLTMSKALLLTSWQVSRPSHSCQTGTRMIPKSTPASSMALSLASAL